MTKTGVGVSEKQDSVEAAYEATKNAMEKSGSDSCDLVIFYTSDKHDPKNLQAGIKKAAGDNVKIFGGHSMGIITNDFIGYDGFQVGVAAISSKTINMDIFTQTGLANNEYTTGKGLAEQISAKEYSSDPNVLLMYDSVKKPASEGLELNLATPLIQGIEDGFGAVPPIAGVGMTGGMQWNPTFQWVNDSIEQNSAVALVLSGNGTRMDSTILHGCEPAGSYHTVTKSEENIIYEIDGKPALDLIDELMGDQADWDEYPLFLTLGLNKGDKFEEFKQENYANRLCMTIDRDKKALIMFEPDLVEGSEVRLMRRSINFDYIKPSVEQFLQNANDKKPFLAVYIDCLARASAYCGSETEEAAEVQAALGDIPLLGMYSGVEVAKVGNDLQALDWTGVLVLFSE